MGKYDLKLLDCTLRDGGYINNWHWGFGVANSIITLLAKSGVDIIEVGFLKCRDKFNPDILVSNSIENLNKLLPKDNKQIIFCAMAMCSDYNIDMLSEYSGEGIELIRVTAHDYDINEGLAFAEQVMQKGYKVSINPINIMGYSDEQLLQIIKKVNRIHPWQFSIVDTFGSMKAKDLDRIVSLIDNNLDGDIRVGLHLHENMSLSCLLVQNFVNKHLLRDITIDGSLMGMGRIPGNLPIELIADYLNEYSSCNYDIDFMMDAIQDYIEPLKGRNKWGYTPAYFLSAKYNLHRNYAEHYLKKGDLTNRDINHLLSRIDTEKATVFDSVYADNLYDEYMNHIIDDSMDREYLKKEICKRLILVIAPGTTLRTCKKRIEEYIERIDPLVISVNFVPEDISVDFAFFSNNKRFSSLKNNECKIIATSNLSGNDIKYKINYNSITGAFKLGCNSLVMLMLLLKQLGVKNIMLAGADGYREDGNDYYDDRIRNKIEQKTVFNLATKEAMHAVGLDFSFLTPSAYE